MRFTVINLIITCLLGSLTPGISQDASMAKSSKPIYLKLKGTSGKFLGPNRDDYATINTEPGDYIFVGDGSALENGKSYKIKTGDMYLYETAKGNAGLYNTAKDEASSWKIEKQKQQCNIKDEKIRHGDIILLSNGYWKTNYLYDYGKGYAAAGDTEKAREWVVEWEVSEVQRKLLNQNTETIYQTLYIDNRGGPASPGAKITLSLEARDEVGVNNTRSDNWNASLSVTAEVDQNSAPGTPSAKFSTTATAAYGGAVEKEKARVQEMKQGKSIETTYDKPNDGEVILLTRLAVPYDFVELSTEGEQPIKMRSIIGAIRLISMTSIYLPSFNKGGELIVVDEADVTKALDILSGVDRGEAERLRTKRLPEWKKNGWVSGAKVAPVVSKALVLAPGTAMTVKQKYWSENKEFYAIFQPDGNFGVSTKGDGYKWDIVTKAKVPAGVQRTPLKAEKLILRPDGNLVFLGPNDTVMWGIDKIITPVPNSTLNISNSGDLLLLAPDGAVLWDSSK